jgi:hypothetical protein
MELRSHILIPEVETALKICFFKLLEAAITFDEGPFSALPHLETLLENWTHGSALQHPRSCEIADIAEVGAS